MNVEALAGLIMLRLPGVSFERAHVAANAILAKGETFDLDDVVAALTNTLTFESDAHAYEAALDVLILAQVPSPIVDALVSTGDDVLNVRIYPATKVDERAIAIVDRLANHRLVNVWGTLNGWSCVTYAKTSSSFGGGWVSEQYLQVK